MTRIGVISDTHLTKPSPRLFDLTGGVFADISLILHAGDLTRLVVLDAFSGVDCIAVRGNMDHSDVGRKLPPHEVFEIQGYRFVLTHGWGAPFGIEDRIGKKFQDAQVIVYGHTHQASAHWKDGAFYFNPGAFSGTFLLKKKCMVGILTLSETITGKIIAV